MGQKVNPHGLRVGVIKDWDSKWIAGKKDFGDQLVEDYNIRKFVIYNGVEIVPIQFLKAVLPDPKSLGANYHGQTSIGCRIRGVKDGKERTYYIYNNCDHEQAFKETGTQAVSFTTGVPAALGASMWAKGLWRGAGVFNVEEFDPDPFLAELGEQGLPWHELFDTDIEL